MFQSWDRVATRAHIAGHANGILDALVVAANASQLAIAETCIKYPGRFIGGPQLEADDEGAGREGGLFEPHHDFARDTTAPVRGVHSEEIQVGDIIAITHDRKAGRRAAATSSQHDTFRVAHVPGDAGSGPGGSQSRFNVLL